MSESPNTSIWSPVGIDQSCGGPVGAVVVALGVGAGTAATGTVLSAIASSVSLRLGAVATTTRQVPTSATATPAASRGTHDRENRSAPQAIRPHSRNPHTRIGASTNRYDRSASAI